MRKHILNELVRPQIHRKFLFAEATFYLMLARLALVCLPFKMLVWFMNRLSRQPELQGEERELLIRAVRWSILRASHRLPVKIVCFPRAIAAQAMLRRRRIGTTLYYGAATQPDKGLMSHVWVQDGQEGVIGFRAANGYKIIAKYPGKNFFHR
jgi:transglutaminase superfamily protein